MHLLEDTSAHVRKSVVAELIRAGIGEATVFDLINDESAGVRAAAASGLIRRGSDPDKFLSLVSDSDPMVRRKVGVAILKAKADPNCVRVLLNDDVQDVRTAVAKSWVLNQREPLAAAVFQLAIDSEESDDVWNTMDFLGAPYAAGRVSHIDGTAGF